MLVKFQVTSSNCLCVTKFHRFLEDQNSLVFHAGIAKTVPANHSLTEWIQTLSVEQSQSQSQVTRTETKHQNTFFIQTADLPRRICGCASWTDLIFFSIKERKVLVSVIVLNAHLRRYGKFGCQQSIWLFSWRVTANIIAAAEHWHTSAVHRLE